MNLKTLASVGSLTCMLAVTACATTGTAAGEDVEKGNVAKAKVVTMQWKSDAADSTRGHIETTLTGDRKYGGSYVQITSTTTADVLSPFWEPWPEYWPDWPVTWGEDDEGDDGWDDSTAFITRYSNHVIARLTDQNGNGPVMRCRFTLDRPIDGMAGGGTGQCQVGNDEKIEDVTLTRG